MINKEHIMNIRSLAKQGYSQRQIARMTGLNRRTVRRYLQEGLLPVYHNEQRQGMIDPYKTLIEGWLSKDDYQATRIHELLILQGFQGSYTTARRYVQRIKERRDRKAYVRFETMPGQQAQVDFGDFQITEPDGSKATVYCFIMALGYSRNMYIEFIKDCTMVNFLACHQHAFGFFGGIPAEILYDNMKNVVIKRLVGAVEWNKEFAAFCVHYGFKPLVAPPYSPWVKGKVERPIGYVRERFWRGYVFNDIPQANKDIRQWINNVANQRVHGTTQEKVEIRFGREKPYLGVLPRQPYDISEKAYRKVQKDCQIAFQGNRYVVPHEYVGHNLLLKIRDGILRIFCDDQMLAVYRIPIGRGRTLADPRFYQRLKDDQEQIRRKYHKPSGKAKATRGLIKNGLSVEVMQRPLSIYDQEVDDE
jgi:transposase